MINSLKRSCENKALKLVQYYLPAIKSHKAVEGIAKGPSGKADGSVRLEIIMSVSLPTKAQCKGVSETGVKEKEHVTLNFPPTFPSNAPKIQLRKDFNRNLPHLNPSPENEYVEPCIVDADLSEVLHQKDWLINILNQLSEWLTKAAGDRLIDSAQGWEPIRRDQLAGSVVFSKKEMLKEINNESGNVSFIGFVIKINETNIHGFVNTGKKIEVIKRKTLYEHKFFDTPFETYEMALCFLFWANKEVVCDKYLPETVFSIEDLYVRAKEYGCKNLKKFLLDSYNGVKKKPFNAIIILAVNRPFKLIGDYANVEMVSYLVEVKWDGNQVDKSSNVSPLSHKNDCSPEILRKLSGTPVLDKYGFIIQLGCGSLGSKISMHLARAGHEPFVLVDNKIFAPHNSARHALVESFKIPTLKAILLENSMRAMGTSADSLLIDAVEFLSNTEINNKLPKTRILIDSTASLSVFSELIDIAPHRISEFVCHTALYGNGDLGVLLVEGKNRNPRVDDLMTKLFDLALERNELASILYDKDINKVRQIIGDGCGSFTMVMPDTLVSEYSAGMAQRAKSIIEKGKNNEGELWIGLSNKSGLGINWECIYLEKPEIIKNVGGSAWELRMLPDVVNTINEEALSYNEVETGGVLMGHVSWSNRVIIVSRLLPAPRDSARSRNSFALGTEGLKDFVISIQKATNGVITYLGTWHSHPSGVGSSPIDRKTLEGLREHRLGMPSTMLIWTPGGFHALFDEGELKPQ